MAEAWRGIETEETPPGLSDSPVPAGYGPLDRGRDRGPQPPPPADPRPSADETAPEPPPGAERPAGFAALATSPAGASPGEPAASGHDHELEPPAEGARPAPPEWHDAPPAGAGGVSTPPDDWSPPPSPDRAAAPAQAAGPGAPVDPPTGPMAPVGAPTTRRTGVVPPASPPQRRPGEPDVVRGPVQGRLRPHQEVRVVRGVRARRLIRRIDVITVFKVSVAFYAVAVLTLLIAGIVVWNVADAFGLISSIQKSVRTLFSLKSFTLHAGSVFGWSLAIGAVLCVFGALLNTLMAVIYNLLSDVVGGIQVVVVSETDAA